MLAVLVAVVVATMSVVAATLTLSMSAMAATRTVSMSAVMAGACPRGASVVTAGLPVMDRLHEAVTDNIGHGWRFAPSRAAR